MGWQGFREDMLRHVDARLFTYGSYRLGVHDPGADIDTCVFLSRWPARAGGDAPPPRCSLCVSTRDVSREEFFDAFVAKARVLPSITELSPVPDA